MSLSLAKLQAANALYFMTIYLKMQVRVSSDLLYISNHSKAKEGI